MLGLCASCPLGASRRSTKERPGWPWNFRRTRVGLAVRSALVPLPSSHSPWIYTMNRCARRTVLARMAAMAAFWSLPLLSTAHAQGIRSFPANALRGELVVTQTPELLLNGKPARLAPGARIRGEDNLLVMSGAITGQRFKVHYTVDISGQVLDVWILTPQELAKRIWPTTPEQAATWSFDPVAQEWSRP
jgi:hypothetical protein